MFSGTVRVRALRKLRHNNLALITQSEEVRGKHGSSVDPGSGGGPDWVSCAAEFELAECLLHPKELWPYDVILYLQPHLYSQR